MTQQRLLIKFGAVCSALFLQLCSNCGVDGGNADFPGFIDVNRIDSYYHDTNGSWQWGQTATSGRDGVVTFLRNKRDESGPSLGENTEKDKPIDLPSIDVLIFVAFTIVIFTLLCCCTPLGIFMGKKEPVYSTDAWLGRGANPYLISIVTGSNPVIGGAPTVRIVLRGERWKSEIYTICPQFYLDKAIFRPGNTDNFVIDTYGTLGNLERVTLQCISVGKKSDDWYLKYIKVVDLYTGQSWYFPWHRYLHSDYKHGHLAKVLLKPAPESGAGLFWVNMKHGFCALSPWCALIGWRHGNGGMPQLLHIGVLAVVCTSWMFANIMVYQYIAMKNIINLGIGIGVVTLGVSIVGSLLMWILLSIKSNTVARVLLPVSGEHVTHGCCNGKVKGGKHKDGQAKPGLPVVTDADRVKIDGVGDMTTNQDLEKKQSSQKQYDNPPPKDAPSTWKAPLDTAAVLEAESLPVDVGLEEDTVAKVGPDEEPPRKEEEAEIMEGTVDGAKVQGVWKKMWKNSRESASNMTAEKELETGMMQANAETSAASHGWLRRLVHFKVKKSQPKNLEQPPKIAEQPKTAEGQKSTERHHHRHHRHQHHDCVESRAASKTPTDATLIHKNNSSRSVNRTGADDLLGDDRLVGKNVNVNQNQQHDVNMTSENCLLRSTEEDIVAYLNQMCGCDLVDGSPKPALCGQRSLRDITCRCRQMRSDSSLEDTRSGTQLGELILENAGIKRCPLHVQRKLALESRATRLSSTIAHCAVSNSLNFIRRQAMRVHTRTQQQVGEILKTTLGQLQLDCVVDNYDVTSIPSSSNSTTFSSDNTAYLVPGETTKSSQLINDICMQDCNATPPSQESLMKVALACLLSLLSDDVIAELADTVERCRSREVQEFASQLVRNLNAFLTERQHQSEQLPLDTPQSSEEKPHNELDNLLLVFFKDNEVDKLIDAVAALVDSEARTVRYLDETMVPVAYAMLFVDNVIMNALLTSYVSFTKSIQSLNCVEQLNQSPVTGEVAHIGRLSQTSFTKQQDPRMIQEWRRCIVSILQSTYNCLKAGGNKGVRSPTDGATTGFDYKGELCRYRIGELAQVVVGSTCGREILQVLYQRSTADLIKASGQLDLHKEMCDHRSMAELGQCLLEGTNHTDLMDILRSLTRELKADVLTEACDGVLEDLIAILEEGDRMGDDGDRLLSLVEEFLQTTQSTEISPEASDARMRSFIEEIMTIKALVLAVGDNIQWECLWSDTVSTNRLRESVVEPYRLGNSTHKNETKENDCESCLSEYSSEVSEHALLIPKNKQHKEVGNDTCDLKGKDDLSDEPIPWHNEAWLHAQCYLLSLMTADDHMTMAMETGGGENAQHEKTRLGGKAAPRRLLNGSLQNASTIAGHVVEAVRSAGEICCPMPVPDYGPRVGPLERPAEVEGGVQGPPWVGRPPLLLEIPPPQATPDDIISIEQDLEYIKSVLGTTDDSDTSYMSEDCSDTYEQLKTADSVKTGSDMSGRLWHVHEMDQETFCSDREVNSVGSQSDVHVTADGRHDFAAEERCHGDMETDEILVAKCPPLISVTVRSNEVKVKGTAVPDVGSFPDGVGQEEEVDIAEVNIEPNNNNNNNHNSNDEDDDNRFINIDLGENDSGIHNSGNVNSENGSDKDGLNNGGTNKSGNNNRRYYKSVIRSESSTSDSSEYNRRGRSRHVSLFEASGMNQIKRSETERKDEETESSDFDSLGYDDNDSSNDSSTETYIGNHKLGNDNNSRSINNRNASNKQQNRKRNNINNNVSAKNYTEWKKFKGGAEMPKPTSKNHSHSFELDETLTNGEDIWWMRKPILVTYYYPNRSREHFMNFSCVTVRYIMYVVLVLICVSATVGTIYIGSDFSTGQAKKWLFFSALGLAVQLVILEPTKVLLIAGFYAFIQKQLL